MIRVIYKGNRVREYSQEEHGSDYKALAAEFCKKFNGTIEGSESVDSNIEVPTSEEVATTNEVVETSETAPVAGAVKGKKAK